MKRVTILNCSVIAAIFLISCFNEVGGFPHNLESSEIYRKTLHSSGNMSPFRAFGKIHENLSAFQRATREVNNHNDNLIHTANEIPQTLKNTRKTNEIDHGIVIDARQKDSEKHADEVLRENIRTDKLEIGQYNPGDIGKGHGHVDPPDLDSSDEIDEQSTISQSTMYNYPMNSNRHIIDSTAGIVERISGIDRSRDTYAELGSNHGTVYIPSDNDK